MKDDGGPAFPTTKPRFRVDADGNETIVGTFHIGGMSLRDYFAAAAMQGFLANPEASQAMVEIAKLKDVWEGDVAARIAYNVADAMIEQRNKETTNDDRT